MLNLFRADEKGRKTGAENYAKGLLTKQVDSHDDPEPHMKYGWLTTIKSHIKPNGSLEQFIYDTTAYLSFTTDINICKSYLATSRKLNFVKTSLEKADAYIFTFQINNGSCRLLESGIYLYSFPCNYGKIATDPKFMLSPMIAPFIKCQLCQINGTTPHHIILIDAVTYLSPLKHIYPEAFINANNSKEWLLLPADPMVGNSYNKGFQSRIPVADCWDVEFYRYQ